MLRTHAPRIPRPVSFARRFGLAVFGERLFAVGGYGFSGYLSSVETLSSAGGEWANETYGLNTARYGCVGAPRP